MHGPSPATSSPWDNLTQLQFEILFRLAPPHRRKAREIHYGQMQRQWSICLRPASPSAQWHDHRWPRRSHEGRLCREGATQIPVPAQVNRCNHLRVSGFPASRPTLRARGAPRRIVSHRHTKSQSIPRAGIDPPVSLAGRSGHRLSWCRGSRQRQEVMRGRPPGPSIGSVRRALLSQAEEGGQEGPCWRQVADRKQHAIGTKVPRKVTVSEFYWSSLTRLTCPSLSELSGSPFEGLRKPGGWVFGTAFSCSAPAGSTSLGPPRESIPLSPLTATKSSSSAGEG